MAVQVCPGLEWSTVAAPISGEIASGDLGLVLTVARGFVLAMIDGLGHGLEANRVAELAAAAVAANDNQPLVELFARCHAALRATRGAVIALAIVDVTRDELSWFGIGNIVGLLVRGVLNEDTSSAWMPSRGGIVGDRLIAPRPATLALRRGDTLVLATDGIQPAFKQEVKDVRSVEEIAHAIFSRHARGNDDACVVVARYTGARSPAR